MQSVIDTLKSGNSRERLAVVADILSILGVSLAAVVGGILTLSTSLRVANVIGAAISSLLSLAGAALVLVACLATSAWLSRKFAFNPLFRSLVHFSLWAVFASLFLLAAFIAYEFFSSVRFTQ